MGRIAITAAVAAAAVGLSVPAMASAAEPVTEPDFYRLPSTVHVLDVPAPGVLGNDTDADGDQLKAVKLGEPYYGRLHLNADGSFRYRPDPLNPGYDNFNYWAYDGNSLATIGHVYLTLTRPPVAHDDDYAALTGVRRRERDPGLLGNDFAQEGHAELRRGARHGTATVGPGGAFDYTSDPGFVGTDDFRYVVVVDGERQSVATATIRVKASDRKPQAVADTLTTPEDVELDLGPPGVLANDTDPDGDPLTAVWVDDPFGEYFSLESDGSLTYQPPSNYDTPVTFTYRVSDGLKLSDPVESTIEIPAVDDAPTAVDDEYELHARRLEIGVPGVVGNDYDEVEGDIVYAHLQMPPQHGTVHLHRDGSFVYVQDRLGPRRADTFTYSVSDSGGAEGGLATVFIDPFR
jgi:hypothetical protein